MGVVNCGRFSNADNFRPEVHNDVMSGTDPIGVKVRVNIGVSRSNRSRDLRLPLFVTNDHDHSGVRRSSRKGKTPQCILSNYRYASMQRSLILQLNTWPRQKVETVGE